MQLGPPTSRTPYDVTASGRFVGMVTSGQGSFIRGSATEIRVVLSWFQDLKRRVPLR
jgi:hypothetical protein